MAHTPVVKGAVLLPNTLPKQEITTDEKGEIKVTFTLTSDKYFRCTYPCGYVKHHDTQEDVAECLMKVMATITGRYNIKGLTQTNTIEEAKTNSEFIFKIER